MADGVLMVNGDTVHPVSVEETLLAARGPEVLLALDTEKPLAHEEMKVQVGPTGFVTRINKAIDPALAYGEYIGASLIEGSVVPRLADALRVTFERDPHLYYEDGYQELADRGEQIATVSIPTGTSWVEVDDQADLRRAREIACHY
jgi:choline kinase